MVRTNTGISQIPVNEEIDPGFGSDREQRRIEFAAKMEEEAYQMALGDATKIARMNLITALRLWKKSDLTKKISSMTLRDIMLIWLVFQYLYFILVYQLLTEKNLFISSLEDSGFVNEFFERLLVANYTDLPTRIQKFGFEPKKIQKIREELGGDLIFGLEKKNFEEVAAVYEKALSRLPKSLREDFYEMISGIDIQIIELKNILNKDNSLLIQNISSLIAGKLNAVQEYTKERERLSTILEMINAYSPEIARELSKNLQSTPSISQEEVEDRVKRYYGITD